MRPGDGIEIADGLVTPKFESIRPPERGLASQAPSMQVHETSLAGTGFRYGVVKMAVISIPSNAPEITADRVCWSRLTRANMVSSRMGTTMSAHFQPYRLETK